MDSSKGKQPRGSPCQSHWALRSDMGWSLSVLRAQILKCVLLTAPSPVGAGLLSLLFFLLVSLEPTRMGTHRQMEAQLPDLEQKGSETRRKKRGTWEVEAGKIRSINKVSLSHDVSSG